MRTCATSEFVDVSGSAPIKVFRARCLYEAHVAQAVPPVSLPLVVIRTISDCLSSRYPLALSGQFGYSSLCYIRIPGGTGARFKELLSQQFSSPG